MCWKHRRGDIRAGHLLQMGSQLAPGRRWENHSAQRKAWASQRNGTAGQRENTLHHRAALTFFITKASQALEVLGSFGLGSRRLC